MKKIIPLVALLTMCSCTEIVEFEDFANTVSNKSSVENISAKNWLSAIPNNHYISELSIPGTHESAALYEGWPNTAKCQDLNIEEQLNIGIRYLDIRCRHQYNRFDIFHGFVSQKQNFSNIIETCKSFLKEHPSEFIVMSVKQEYKSRENDRSFEETFRDYINNESENIFYLDSEIPTVEDARGKIVLFRRFYSKSDLGIHAEHGWYDNREGVVINNNSSQITIQDKYKFDNNDYKWNLIVNHFENITDKKRDLYLNNTSGYMGLIPNIKSVSNTINHRLLDYTNNLNPNTKLGIVGMDFTTKELAKAIYTKQNLNN